MCKEICMKFVVLLFESEEVGNNLNIHRLEQEKKA